LTNRLTSCISSRTFSNRKSRFLPLSLAAGFVMAFAILTLSAAPVRLAAQQPTATAGEQPAGTAANTPPAEKLSQEEQNKAFLTGGPIVKWTARTLNTSVETASTIFQLFNFLVIVLLVAVPLARVFPKIFRKRSITLGQNLQAAREATEEANARLRAVEEKLAGLDGEIKKLQAQVEQESLEDEKRVKASLAEESARIVESAEQELGVAVAQAQRNLRHFAADLAIEQAARQMTLSPEADRALIAEFIGSVAKSDGGQK
jgi:F-type H+-transporting ATPase subunit b